MTWSGLAPRYQSLFELATKPTGVRMRFLLKHQTTLAHHALIISKILHGFSRDNAMDYVEK